MTKNTLFKEFEEFLNERGYMFTNEKNVTKSISYVKKEFEYYTDENKKKSSID